MSIFPFLFGRTRYASVYRVFYSLKDSSFVLADEYVATSPYDANRAFDMEHPPEHIRIPNSTTKVVI